MLEKYEQKLLQFTEKLSKNVFVTVLKRGFSHGMAILIVGSICCLIANFPNDAWKSFLSSITLGSNGETLKTVIAKGQTATMTVYAVFVCIAIAYEYAKIKKQDELNSAFIALMVFFLMILFENGGIPTKYLGSAGIIVAVFIGFVSVAISSWVNDRGWIIKLPAGVPPEIQQSFASLIPSFVTAGVFMVVYAVLHAFDTNLFVLIYNVIQKPFQNIALSLPSFLLFYILIDIFWFFGIHAGSVLLPFLTPFLSAATTGNSDFFVTGVGTQSIIDSCFRAFVTGGVGGLFALTIAMVLFAKSAKLKTLGKISIVPALFNIVEPIIFGLPCVLNVVILIPMILCTTFNIVVAYILKAIGIVAIGKGLSLPFTVPCILAGFLNAGVSGGILQILLTIVNVLIYIPFLRVLDKEALEEESSNKEAEEINLDDIDLSSL